MPNRWVTQVSYNTGGAAFSTARGLNSLAAQVNQNCFCVAVHVVSADTSKEIKKGASYCLTGVNAAPLGNENDLFFFCKGYITQYDGISWSGIYPMQAGDYLFLNNYCNVAHQVRANFTMVDKLW